MAIMIITFSFPYRYGGGMSSAKAALESDTRVWYCTVVYLNYLFTCTSFFFLTLFPTYQCRCLLSKLDVKAKSELTPYLQVCLFI